MLGERLRKFGLSLSGEKTRVIEFSSRTPLGKDRSGKPRVNRRTSRKKLRKSKRLLSIWCRANRNLKEKDLLRVVNAKLRGYYNYYGVIGNYRSLNQFFLDTMRVLHKWLNRRSQRKSITWAEFRLMYLPALELPRIIERSGARLAASTAWGLGCGCESS
jgi:RNA-directed DNA polymerase